MRTHLCIYNGDKPYQCQYCRKGFNDNNNLQKHLHIHNFISEKYYQHVEEKEPSFESFDCKLSNKFFELFGDDNNENMTRVQEIL